MTQALGDFDARAILAAAGCPSVAAQISIVRASVEANALGFYLATVWLAADSSCPQGLFECAVAVDLDPSIACVRATFEAVERYCLGAVGHHENRFRRVTATDPRLFRFNEGFCDGYSYGSDITAVEARTYGSDQVDVLVPIGDVFAPYRLKDGNIGAPSTTNGVGCHTRVSSAIEAAAFELLERHWIMHYWFNDQTIARDISLQCASTRQDATLSLLDSLGYDVQLLRLSDNKSAPAVLGFAFHRDGAYPAGVCSASMKPTLSAAVRSCLLELMQTLVSVSFSSERYDRWHASGAPMKSLEHNMFALASPLHAMKIRALTSGAQVASGPDLNGGSINDAVLQQMTIVDVTPSAWKDEVSVVRVLSDKLHKLVVGDAFGESRLLRSRLRIPHPHPFP